MMKMGQRPGLAVFAALTVLLPACRDRNQVGSTLATHPVETICVRCNAVATIQSALPADQEEWPKQCASCQRHGVHAAARCASCGAVIPLMDPRTNAYALPKACPQCNKTWGAKTSSRPS